jgi:alanine-glyoxylate transaminase/serine-glyoxylate transaminase/serine-pyruvate transaminase
MSPIVFSPRALEKKVACRSFYFDVTLLEDYWVRRKYHHTMSASLIYALREALAGVEEEGLQARWGAPRAQPPCVREGPRASGVVVSAIANRALMDAERGERSPGCR